MNGCEIIKYIYTFLSNDEQIKELVDVEHNIVPLMTPPNTFPFIMMTRDSIEVKYSKDGPASDLVNVQLSIVGKDYYNTCKILSAVRSCLEWKCYSDGDITIKDIIVTDIYEDFSVDSFVQTLTIQIDVAI